MKKLRLRSIEINCEKPIKTFGRVKCSEGLCKVVLITKSKKSALIDKKSSLLLETNRDILIYRKPH